MSTVEETDPVSERLKRWGLSTKVIQTFKEQKITEEIFPHLDNNNLRALIPLIGERLLFEIKFNEEVINKQIHVDIAINDTEEPIETIIVVDETDKEFQLLTSTVNEYLDVSDNTEERNDEYDLQSILQKYDKGLILLREYNVNKKLSFKSRNCLADIIISYELKDDLDKRLSPERLELISNKIVELFPTETKETYIDIDVSSGICNTGKGKLYYKWYNKRRQFTKSNLIPGRKGRQIKRKRARDDDEIIVVNKTNDNNEALLWLKNSSQPWPLVVRYWQQTWTERWSELLADKISVGQYMAQYPALHDEKGYTLLECDFEKKSPDKILKLLLNWPKLSEFLYEKLRTKIKYFDTNIISEDVKTLKILTSISHLFACVNARKQTKVIKKWRPSKIEMQEGFILHVKVIGDLEVQLDYRQEKLAQHGCGLQPLVAIVGPNLEEIHQRFVVLGINKYYEVETTLKAVDICFKVFHALHILYPPECAQIWQFIQRAAYEMPRNRQYDPYYNSVEVLLKEYLSYRSPTLE